ncbi:nucleotidyl transferase AbiEii/AbiGii toxin family protein [Shewanella sp. 202IG2-18]|uniref:nucleotidyl transferase AbiEii/AbiGii toxin family protein n=1 Tax=Parashewanella hymeniacidonis TaxID=2807618 RepID=UPI001960B2E9|nr:nucleotidyl transferase AbiEii/AbiGii toxin family protein [Parashewanella hymeniacidonis]MBM7072408.1 nucleotidyl transferase AbiEii/AbiGii toxin family protein [Parashewanella hymeniacidonis]
MSENFSELVKAAMAQESVAKMQPVVEKELLHYDILFCLEKAGLLNDLVFQGGTSLRLCRGGSRFSEDLDFAGGADFSSEKLQPIKTCIENYIGERYGLEVTVKEPSALKKLPEYAELKIDKWQIAVVTSPEQKHIPKQKIKLEVANIPAYHPEPVALTVNYQFLPDSYAQTILVAESLDEILADKIISLPATQKYVRYRDVWDLVWLIQQGAKLNIELVELKIKDYQLDTFETMLNTLILKLKQIVISNEFKQQMERFLPTDVVERTLEEPKFIQYLENTLLKLFKDVAQSLYQSSSAAEIEFKM